MSLTIIALLLASSPAPAQQADANAKEKKEKIVCVDQGETGSRLNKKRVCRTVSQWQQERQDARDMLERAHRSQTNPGD